MSFFLFLEHFRESDEDAAFLYVAEFVVYCRAEHLHCRRETHVGVYERRDVKPLLTHRVVENAVVLAVVVSAEKPREAFGIHSRLKRIAGSDEMLRVGKMLVHEEKDHVAAYLAVAGIHGHLAEQVFYSGIEHHEGTQPVPQVVEGENCLRTRFCRLVFSAHERPPKLDCMREIVAYKFFREIEHVACGYSRDAVVYLYVWTENEAVASGNLLCLRIPDNELAARGIHCVVGIYVALFPCAAATLAESDFAQPAYLAHGIWGGKMIHHIYFVAPLVGAAQKPLRDQFFFYQLNSDRVDYFLHAGLMLIATLRHLLNYKNSKFYS